MLKVAEKLTTKVSNPSRLSYFPNRCTVVPSSNLSIEGVGGPLEPRGPHACASIDRMTLTADPIPQFREVPRPCPRVTATLEAPGHDQSTSSPASAHGRSARCLWPERPALVGVLVGERGTLRGGVGVPSSKGGVEKLLFAGPRGDDSPGEGKIEKIQMGLGDIPFF